jgi:hypothetical protein
LNPETFVIQRCGKSLRSGTNAKELRMVDRSLRVVTGESGK